MYKLCIVVVLCCAFFPRCSAAPKTWGADPRSEFERQAEQNDGLQQAINVRESILSKVGGNIPSSHVLWTFHHFVRKHFWIERGAKFIRPLLFVAAG